MKVRLVLLCAAMAAVVAGCGGGGNGSSSSTTTTRPQTNAATSTAAWLAPASSYRDAVAVNLDELSKAGSDLARMRDVSTRLADHLRSFRLALTGTEAPAASRVEAASLVESAKSFEDSARSLAACDGSSCNQAARQVSAAADSFTRALGTVSAKP